MNATTAVWFRNDLRTHDNPALLKACRSGKTVIGIFIITPEQWHRHSLSPRRLQLTLEALQALRTALGELGIPLRIHSCPTFADVPELMTKIATAESLSGFSVNREFAWDEQVRDRAVAGVCQRLGIEWDCHHASTVIPPGSLQTRQGGAYKVFTPFKKSWLAAAEMLDLTPLPAPQPKPGAVRPACAGTRISGFAPADTKIEGWPTHEQAASERLDQFLTASGPSYQQDRDLPAVEGTSRLSSSLTIGLLSPRQCVHRARLLNQGALAGGVPGLSSWINELIWRDFYIHVMAAFPQVSRNRAFRTETDRLPWRQDQRDFNAWCEGRTGYPLVDAGMRQLVETGWMHNRLRMITAMFLSKYLLLDWRLGEQFFMQHLVDGHFPSNNGGWQWSASTGTDAAPYFRLLSPVRQAQRFDPQALYIKAMLPQLAPLPPKIIQQPGHPSLLETGYPAPIVDLKAARLRCLDAFKSLGPALKTP